MTLLLIVQLFVAGLIGMALHIFAVKLPGHKQKCIAGNVPFSAKRYFKDDWIAIVAAFISVVAVCFVIDEIIMAYPKIQNAIKGLMIAVGFSNSSLLIAVLGKATKGVMGVIDVKTNIADNTNPNQAQ